MKSKFTVPAIQVVFCIFMLLASFYFEYVVELTLCILCAVQRVIVEILLFVSLVNLVCINKPKVKPYCITIGILFCVIGLLLALRQAWMQLHPGLFTGATCLPDIGYMMKVFSFSEIITAVLTHGGPECITMKWSLLGIPMPGWIAFSYTMLLSVYVYNLAPSEDEISS